MTFLKTINLLLVLLLLVSCQNKAKTNTSDLFAENKITNGPQTDEVEIQDIPIEIEEEVEEIVPEVNETKESTETVIEEKIESIEEIAPTSESEKEAILTEVIPAEIAVPVDAETYWNELLQNYVTTSGNVDYAGFKSAEAKLDEYLQWLDETNTSGWSSNKIKANWINAYNAYTIKLILNNYPVKSINEISVGGKGPWDIPLCKVAGETYTLNHIEHEILRKDFNDPRIHVGVNCASYSCPQLPNKAMSESNVNAILDAFMTKFINDSKRNNITSESKAELSEIFNWFKDDFTKNGTLIEYINKYSNTTLNSDATISYLTYNWNLNSK